MARQAPAALEGLDCESTLAGSPPASASRQAWVATAIDATKAVNIGDQITGRTYRYSADVVGVSGDGRAYQRVRIVVDASATPGKIVYRRDMTDAGWPLGLDVRRALRSGAGLVGGYGSMTTLR